MYPPQLGATSIEHSPLVLPTDIRTREQLSNVGVSSPAGSVIRRRLVVSVSLLRCPGPCHGPVLSLWSALVICADRNVIPSSRRNDMLNHPTAASEHPMLLVLAN